MGIIRSQSIKSTIITYIGFSIGAINMMFVMPHFLSNVQIGLISVYIAFATQMVAIGSLGIGVVINKFLPYYRAHLLPKKNDLISLALVVGTFGLLLTLALSVMNKDLVIRKFSKNSPLFVEYLYLFPFFSFGYLYYSILESFNNNYKFSVWTSFVRELFYKFFNLFLVILFAIHWLSFKGVMNLYSVMYWIGALLLLLNLVKNKLFYIPLKLSSLTKKLKFNLLKYSLSTWGISILGVTYQFVDVFAIAGLVGLGTAAIYNIPKFLITAIVIPGTSVINISIPLISDAWRRKDLVKIEEIYKKSALVLVLLCGGTFFLIWSSIDDIFHLLPDKFFGSASAFTNAKYALLILGFARMFDFATSVNSYILQTSKKYYWTDLSCNIASVVLSIPLNYLLIKKYGMIGAATSYFVLAFMSNSFKAGYLYFKEKIHPFSNRWWRLAIICGLAILIGYFLNVLFDLSIFDNLNYTIITRIIKIVLRNTILCGIFIPLVYWLNVSDDISGMIKLMLDKLPMRKK